MIQLEQRMELPSSVLDLLPLFQSERANKKRQATRVEQERLQLQARHRYLWLRGMVEYSFAGLLLLFLAPVIFILGMAIRLTSSGPAIYSQVRVGAHGRRFAIYKLRTMSYNCEAKSGPVWAAKNDPRVTWLGAILRKTHLDELPQLWNVLRGEMSLIGPRPERPEFVTKLETEIPEYGKRLAIRPGITGLAQISQAPDTTIHCVRRKTKYDLFYIQKMNWRMDLQILVATGLKALGLNRYRICAEKPEKIKIG
ncbi:UDP-N-acetylgalactosamine-undecaprenyl-phosphate N-acetylgalactosaminephosphotransferase [Planctomycetales bacterium 10988]|nr:UDP-N-acetylgalactosamine-undecaprenyl-phosphate N-acetylgalactosaminephosphotransferase [Planctomycetales bacterium 10988]